MTATDRLYALAHLALESLIAELEPVNREDAMRALAALNELECIAPLKILPQYPADRCRVCGWPLYATTREGCVADNCSMRPAPKVRADAGYALVRVTTTALPCGALFEGNPSGKTYACARPQGHVGKHKTVPGVLTWGGIGSGLAKEEMPDATEGWPV